MVLHEPDVARDLVAGDQGAGVGADNLDLDLPDGAALLRGVTFTVTAGSSLLVTGPAGAGKSVLLRAIAGIWPFGRGQVTLSPHRRLFVPQLPYSPLGTLAEALLYPLCDSNQVSLDRMAAVLREVGLGNLIGDLNSENWSQRLSQAEQQQLSFARMLLAEPAVVFLDDATSALDDCSAARLYGLLRAGSWRPTIVSASYKDSLFNFHDQVLDISAFYPQPEAPLESTASLAV